MVSISYFPGCSLHGTAREYRESTEAICDTLGVKLEELDDWNCCGSSSAHFVSDRLALALSARNLEIADRAGKDLITPCAACYQRLKLAENELLTNHGNGTSRRYDGNFRIKHLVDFLWEDIGEKELGNRVKKSINELNPVCYYGCLTVRPPLISRESDPENPCAMDNLLQSLGGKVKDWSYKTDCCGGSLPLTRPDIVDLRVQRILAGALEAEADCIVVACPMCFSNLDNSQARISQETGNKGLIPVFYVSELIGVALGEPSAHRWLNRHQVNPEPLLKKKGLI